MISVDRVYQKVLAIANKEQRGYITPQEFNLFAAHAQMDIFEQYFYDINQWSRLPGNSHSYADMLENVEQKISYFKVYDASVVPGGSGDVTYNNNEVYRLGEVKVRYSSNNTSSGKSIAERIKLEDHQLYLDSKLAKENYKRPIYWQRSDPTQAGTVRIRIYPKPMPTVDDVLLTYIRKPLDPKWTYLVTVANPGSPVALYNPANDTQNFELEASEESELIHRILAYSGITLQRPEITQAAIQLESQKIQQEKQ